MLRRTRQYQQHVAPVDPLDTPYTPTLDWRQPTSQPRFVPRSRQLGGSFAPPYITDAEPVLVTQWYVQHPQPARPLRGLPTHRQVAVYQAYPWVWVPKSFETFLAAMRGRYRIAETAQDVYEVYIGQDAAATLTSPTTTGASLPITSAQAANHTYNVVVRRRNAYGLLSENLLQRQVIVNSGGTVATPDPSAPTGITLTAKAAGKVRITAEYNYAADGANKADTWLIYVTTTGVDPNPGTDTPATETIDTGRQVAHLAYTTASYSHGADVRVLVRTRRTGTPNADSDNVTIYTITADAQGPALTRRPDALGRQAYRQEQP